MNSIVTLTHKRYLSFNLVFLVCSLWFWRHTDLLGHGFLPGDNGDARFTMVLYEHWYQFFTGHTGLSQTLFFYPTHDTLVFSDSFFLQGFIHSIFRGAGFGMLNAWLVTTVLVQLFSAYSAVLIAHKLKLRAIPGAVLVIYWGYNSTMWAQSTHVQHVLYPFVGWIILAGFGFMHAQTFRGKILYLTLALNLSLLLALSSIYAFIFSLLYSGLGAAIYIFWCASKNKLHDNILLNLKLFLQRSFKRIDFKNLLKTILVPIILSIPLTFIFLKIYVFDTSFRTVREASTVSFFSPTFTDFFNPPSDNLLFGRVLQKLFSYGLPGTGEPGMGFTPAFLAILLVTIAIAMRKNLSINRELLRVPLMILVSVSFVELLILKDARGFSFWFLTFEQLPGFNSLRALSRIHTFQYMMASLAVAVILDKLIDYFSPSGRIGKVHFNSRLLKISLPLVVVVLILAESTPNVGRWTADELKIVSIAKKSKADFAQCKSFSVVPSDAQIRQRAMYAWIIDAQVLSALYSKPTLQGYSGGEPTDYGIDTSSTSQVLEASIKNVIATKNLVDSCLLYPINKENIKTKWKVVPIIG
ncbi:unannotated protein [freshwater metagenome]|uniref:Unannotated protein n=1 Tax=freshwater metagenome TaxID=449393 RepID=A0A6J7HRF3_9ZZZZ|nr:hypothetical protein [Actinomycetota bacterium]